MSAPEPNDDTHSIAKLALILVGLAIVIITILTITAIIAGPPG